MIFQNTFPCEYDTHSFYFNNYIGFSYINIMLNKQHFGYFQNFMVKNFVKITFFPALD